MAKFNWNDVIHDIGIDGDNQGVNNRHKYLVHMSSWNGWEGFCTFANLDKLANDMCHDMQRGAESSHWTIYDRNGNQLNYKCKLSVEIAK